jgi:hypothetical protein
MAITTAQYTLDTTVAVQICAPDYQPQRVTVHNLETGTGKMIYIGNSGVTTTNSLEMNPQVFFQFVLDPGDSLWAVSNTAGHKVGVLRQKQD